MILHMLVSSLVNRARCGFWPAMSKDVGAALAQKDSCTIHNKAI
jgi:hypothetical protein